MVPTDRLGFGRSLCLLRGARNFAQGRRYGDRALRPGYGQCDAYRSFYEHANIDRYRYAYVHGDAYAGADVNAHADVDGYTDANVLSYRHGYSNAHHGSPPGDEL